MGNTILVVDDAAVIRLMLRKILSEGGYEVTGEAATGKEAVQKYNLLKPDLVIMDITMPEMNGLAALKEIKATDPHARVVICSAMGQKQLVQEAVEAGALSFMVKPFDPERVLEVVAKTLTVSI
ncbi:MAG: response regulator [Firmicutes bacterium]|nr:response regulator [Bacillota bacterium]